MSAERIACIGAGRMGRGIAIAFAYAGHPVQLIDLMPRSDAAWASLYDEALGEVRSSLQALATLGAVADRCGAAHRRARNDDSQRRCRCRDSASHGVVRRRARDA